MFTHKPIMIAALAAMILTATPRQSGTQAGTDPEQTLWTRLKQALTRDDGDDYFNTHVKNAELPPLKVVVTTALMNQGVSKIVLAMSDAGTPEVTLIVHGQTVRMKTQPQAGAELEFHGEAIEFTKAPFMLTFDVAGKNVRTAQKKARTVDVPLRN